ncbi:MAG: hypothetical protein A3G25_05120 [Betaproteobacteria bacterium RIFCSPLOWO2_12_FULL_63_13]|nr:MAG: hypothetical protein A3G25_05120 [Betaproteobacteria bacterium RIFCSPLOWO2_12_FULL_63_13]
MKIRFAVLLLAFAAALPAAHAQTETWHARTVRVVETFPPGGFTDVVARMLSAALTEELGQQFIVDNRPGAGGTIGIENVVKSKPDGYTTIVMLSSFATAAAIYKLPYDPIKGVAPVTMIGEGPFVLVVHPSVQAKSIRALIDLVHAKPGTLNFGSAGIGTDLQLAIELLEQMAGIKLTHVPYKGIAPAFNDLVAGRIHLMLSTPKSASVNIQSGKLRALAVTTARRSPLMADLPAVGELVPGYAVRVWFGMGTTAGTPGAVIARLNQAIAKALQRKDFQERLRGGGVEPMHTTPQAFAQVISDDYAKWSNVIKAGNITAN